MGTGVHHLTDPSAPLPEIRTPERVRLLFIGGLGRSGSTLLDRMLGQVPGLWSLGEVVHIWKRGLLDNERCGCRALFRDCPFWSRVGELAYGGWDALDPQGMLALQHAVDRHRYLAQMVVPRLDRDYQQRLEEYAQLLLRMYRAIHQVSGAEIIVDSTKHASYAYLLRRLPEIDLRVVHLVRDPHGVAYSWTKKVRKPEVIRDEAYMPQHRPAEVGVNYIAYNLMFHGLARLGVPALLVRYEDLVRDARDHVRRILRFAEASAADDPLGFIGAEQVELGENHTIAGNPMRFEKGSLPLRVDEAWRQKMPAGQRRQVTALTWPLLLRYHYLTSARIGGDGSRRG